MKRKMLSVVLTVSVILCSLAFATPAASAATTPATVNVRQATQRINQLIDLMGAHPDGLYFTVNRQPCVQGSHSSNCDNCEVSRVVSQQWLIDLIGMGGIDASLFPAQYNYDGAKWGNNGWQCFGFANFAHWYIFAQKNTDNLVSTLVGTGTMTYSFMTRCRPGDVIRTSGHSMVYISGDQNSFKVIDCNIKSGSTTGACRVRVRTVGYTGERIGVTGVANYDRDNYGNKITVQLNANGGKFDNLSATVDKQFYDDDLFRLLDVPKKSGCRFSGYYTDPNGGELIDQTTAIGSTRNLYAHWTTVLDMEPVKTMEYNGHRYLLFNDCFGFDTASDFASRMGGHLVSITSQDEQNAVAQLIDSASNKKYCYWIGLADYDVSNNYKWNNGESGDYRNWNENEPNNTLGLEHYAAILSAGKKWNDTMEQYYGAGMIIEIDHTVSGTPAAEASLNNHKYYLYNDGMNYDDAVVFAEKAGGHIVTINSAAEEQLLENMINQSGVRENFWIGMTDSHKTGSFTWETGEPMNYTNWNSGEPNDDSGFENRAELSKKTLKWNDNLGLTLGNGVIVEVEEAKTKVLFDSNGGNDVPEVQMTNEGTIIISEKIPVKDYYDFVCWNTSKDGKGTNWQPKSEMPVSAGEITMFAMWKARFGDVDNSGIVEASDSLLVARQSIGKIQIDSTQEFIADVSGDKLVNAVDSLLILRRSIKLIDKYPVEK